MQLDHLVVYYLRWSTPLQFRFHFFLSIVRDPNKERPGYRSARSVLIELIFVLLPFGSHQAYLLQRLCMPKKTANNNRSEHNRLLLIHQSEIESEPIKTILVNHLNGDVMMSAQYTHISLSLSLALTRSTEIREHLLTAVLCGPAYESMKDECGKRNLFRRSESSQKPFIRYKCCCWVHLFRAKQPNYWETGEVLLRRCWSCATQHEKSEKMQDNNSFSVIHPFEAVLPKYSIKHE